MEKTASKGIFRLFSDSGGVLARQAQPLPQVLTCQFCSSGDVGQGLRVCNSNELSGDSEAAGLRATLSSKF